jgi:peptidyl-tRNA hydrolase, PTH1 family
MKLIVGLGNPGAQYDGTRHNVGFVVADILARQYAPGEPGRARFHGLTLDVVIDGEKVLLIKPATYMNRSGLAVSEAVGFYKLDPAEDLLVIVDDIALPCGTIRLRSEGGAGGHNGLIDIEQKLGTRQYARLRIGIDQPDEIPQSDYVLSRFRPDQLELIEPALNEAADAAACWVTHGIIETMNRFNRKGAVGTEQ